MVIKSHAFSSTQMPAQAHAKKAQVNKDRKGRLCLCVEVLRAAGRDESWEFFGPVWVKEEMLWLRIPNHPPETPGLH